MKHSQEILDRLYAITNKRPATVIRHLLEHDYITTEELREKYGYRHPPRAIRDVRERGINCFMLISPSANRLKSWTCEHCPNWSRKDISCCEHCFWAYPENYTRICGKERRQIIITFTENEIKDYDKLVSLVGLDKAEVTIKTLISNFVKPQDNK